MKTETKFTERTNTGEYIHLLKPSLRIYNGLTLLHAANEGWTPDEFQAGMAKRLEGLETLLPLFSKLEFSPMEVWHTFRAGLFAIAEFAGWDWFPTAWVHHWLVPAQDGTAHGQPADDRPNRIDLTFFDRHCWLAAPRVPFRPELEHVAEGMALEVKQRRKRADTNAPWLFDVLGGSGRREERGLEVPTNGTWVPVPTDEKTFTRLAERRYFLEPRLVPKAESRPPRSVAGDLAAALAEKEAAEAARRKRDGSLNAMLGKFFS